MQLIFIQGIIFSYTVLKKLFVTIPLNSHNTVETKDRFLPHFGQFSTFEFCKYESFAALIMPKHSSDRNFRPCLF